MMTSVIAIVSIVICVCVCTPGGTRTHNLQLRRLLHYPVVLRERVRLVGLEPTTDGL